MSHTFSIEKKTEHPWTLNITRILDLFLHKRLEEGRGLTVEHAEALASKHTHPPSLSTTQPTV
jgi:hypothetical protein